MPAKDGQTKSCAWLWMLSAFCVAILSSGLVAMGSGERGTAAVQTSARLSFLLFLAAYVGGPLAGLFGPLFDGLARRGREFGLAFAAAFSVHLGLVVVTIEHSARPFVPNPLIIAEIAGALWICTLAVFSIARLRLVLSPSGWRRLRLLGMDYIALIFARNFVSFPLKPLYVPLLVFAIAAIVLRIAAAVKGRRNAIGNDRAQDDDRRLRIG